MCSSDLGEAKGILSVDPRSRKVFLDAKTGGGPEVGSLIVQEDLARTLEEIAADGAEGFYRGKLAKRIAAACQAQGVLLTERDLASCQAERVAPISIRYRGYEVRQTPPNSTGFVMLQELKIAERFDLAALSPAERTHILVEAKKLAFLDRERYGADPRVASLVSAVVPVAGLLAETALTLREDEVASLRQLAVMDPQERAALLRSVDDALDVHRSPLTAGLRASLLDRFGLFGLRLAVEHLAADPATSAGELSRLLLARSGLTGLLELLNQRFAATGRLLQARSALRALRAVAARLEAGSPGSAGPLVRTIDEIESAGEFTRLAAAHLAASGTAALTDDERAEAAGLLLAADPAAVLRGRDDPALLEAIERWRNRGGGAFADSSLVAVCDAMAREYEAAYVARL